MMVLTTEEFIAMNAMIDASPIYGLTLLGLDLPEEERISQVITSLQEKEIMKGHSLTDKGHLLARSIEAYKQSQMHVFINRLRIGLIDDTHAIVIEKKENNEFIIARSLKVTIVKKLILSAPFLQKETKKTLLPFAKEKMEEAKLEKELDNPQWTEMMLIQKHSEHKMFLSRLYYMNRDIAYLYDYIDRERIQKSPQDIRIELMELLEIGGD